MLSQNQLKSTLTIIALFLCSTYGAFSQARPEATPKPTPRKTFGLQIEVSSADPAAKVEGAKIIVESEEEGVSYNKKGITSKKGVANFSQVPQGKLKVQVVAKEFDTFGEIFNLTQDNQLIKITVKKRVNPT